MFEVTDRHVQRRLERANIPAKFRRWDWTDLDPYQGDAVDKVTSWVNAVVDGDVIESQGPLGGRGLLLWGRPGHGKTALASVALQAILRGSHLATWGSGYTKLFQPSRGAYMTYYRKIPEAIQRGMNDAATQEEDELLKDLTGVRFDETALRLLVLDDVGKEHRTASGWASGLLEGLIRDRYYSGWPTVITTNLTPEQWVKEYGESAASFFKEAFSSIEVVSPIGDRR